MVLKKEIITHKGGNNEISYDFFYYIFNSCNHESSHGLLCTAS